MIKIVVFALLFTLTAGNKTSYINYKVFRILPKTVEQNNLLHNILNFHDGYSFWNGPSIVNRTADLMVAPSKILEFKKMMADTETKYSTYIDNVQELIDNENPQKGSRFAPLAAGNIDWTRYYDLRTIYAWLDVLAKKYPGKVEVIVGGSTFEGRTIKGVKVSFKKGNPGIFLEGNIHAREWISSATVTYILHELLTSQNPDVRNLANKNDWYIFPVLNPDGFVHSHTKDRLWRKSRSINHNHPLCTGVDLNRNWDYLWNQGGASSLPCSDNYAGPTAFSEIETKSMAHYIQSISQKFYAYITFHSYSQLLLFPYGHTKQHLENYDDLLACGRKAITALFGRHGTKYITGTAAEIMYITNGCSMDWAKGKLKIPIAYTYELRDKGSYGFFLPGNQIIPTGEETLDSLVAMFKEAEIRGIPKHSH